MIAPAFEQFNRTQEIERQAREGGTGQGVVINNTTNNNISDNSSNSPIAASFPQGTSNLDAAQREAVARSND